MCFVGVEWFYLAVKVQRLQFVSIDNYFIQLDKAKIHKLYLNLLKCCEQGFC